MIQDHMPDNVLDALEKVLLIIWKWGKIIHQRRNITHITLFVELCSHIKKSVKSRLLSLHCSTKNMTICDILCNKELCAQHENKIRDILLIL